MLKKQLDEGYHMFRHLEIENVKIKERILIDDGERERERGRKLMQSKPDGVQ